MTAVGGLLAVAFVLYEWKLAPVPIMLLSSCIIGSLIAGAVVMAMARPGVQYHIGYLVLARSIVGMYGSMVFSPTTVPPLLSVYFRCIFGHNWTDFKNTLPASANVAGPILLCFFIVWLIELPFMFVYPTKIDYLFTIKGFIMPVATFGLFGWCMANGAGIATIDLASAAAAKAQATTPLPGLARYCRKTRDAGWVQGAAVFFSKVVVYFLGLAATASMQGAWGKAYWNIWDFLTAILDHHWTGASRTAVFLVSLSFLFSAMSVNFGGNSIPFGADMTGLFPRYLSIRRGQVLCAVLGAWVVPWELIANAASFLSFLGSYNIFIAPLCAIILVDYVFAHNGNIHVPSLYDGSKSGLYWFSSGVNWLSVFAWLAGVSIGLPGLMAQYQPQAVGLVGKRMYTMGWILTFATAAVVYFIGIKVFPPRIYPAGFGMPANWEYLAKDGREGFFDGEREREGGFSEARVPKSDL
ncbi:permease for cytosine/purines, uracil, thiamine, allantoin-domain-containing protein [Lasiosphaeria miniovina]|uniref:Permease for cytosine/purines, uracil, thiamine, allantoin-domain-containing protein n=1 Tax=Lasiosphaeria miniovina TaxID=1954250 RepID=A0AA40ABX9_9PEZI|nr:permease for cytosine/purines, uracil, thiamine, allantoin-domain-containing protein [Lasiosphaeria miniovina]KAK0713048.1 permease for cytosine/purines, uracil, thiamine, allantoin-domain-containing protein [Lasiosphaeria miniovina]